MRTYEATELNNMTKQEVIEIVNREAERLNKQITRARKAKLPLKEVFTSVRRFTRFSKNTKLTQRQLVERYKKMEQKAQGGYTKANVAKRLKEKAEAKKVLRIPKEEPFSTERFQEYLDMIKRASTEAASFYQFLRYGVQNDYFDNYTDFDREATKGKENREEYVRQQLEEINRKIKESNKQGRNDLTEEQENEDIVHYEDLAKMALDFESTVGQDRLRLERFTILKGK